MSGIFKNNQLRHQENAQGWGKKAKKLHHSCLIYNVTSNTHFLMQWTFIVLKE